MIILIMDRRRDEIDVKHHYEDNNKKKYSDFGTGEPIPMEDDFNEQESFENPFEATRQRIEKLKKDGQLYINDKTTETVTVALPTLQKSLANEKKKISQIKVNPKIAATFSKMKNKTYENPNISESSNLDITTSTIDLNLSS